MCVLLLIILQQSNTSREGSTAKEVITLGIAAKSGVLFGIPGKLGDAKIRNTCDKSPNSITTAEIAIFMPNLNKHDPT
jgi:hypothetical protein